MAKFKLIVISTVVAALAIGTFSVDKCDGEYATAGEEVGTYPWCHFAKVYNHVVWLNWIGRFAQNAFGSNLAPLDVDSFKEAIHSIYASEDSEHLAELLFPQWESQINDYEVVAKEINANRKISLFGRFVVHALFTDGIEVQRFVYNFFAANPEVSEISVKKPIIIVGLHRTGSTFLQRLLSLDPHANNFELWKRKADPLKNRTMEEYMEEVDSEFDQMRYLSPDLNDKIFQLHNMSSALPEEDIMLMYDATPAMQDLPWQLLPPKSSHFNNSMDPANKRWVYLFFKRRLQMWSTTRNRFVVGDENEIQRRHWVLKAPVHSEFMDILVSEFPDARLVICHRDFEAALLSYVAMTATFLAVVVSEDDAQLRELSLVLRDYYTILVDRLLQFLERDRDDNAFHISYRTLIEQPIEVVKAIYAHFDMKYTEAFDKALQAHLQANPPKQSPRRYTREQLGLSWDDIYAHSEAINMYNDRFNNLKEPSKTATQEKLDAR